MTTYQHLYQQAEQLAVDYNKAQKVSGVIELKLVDTLIQLSGFSDFYLKTFCEELGLVHSTMAVYRSEMLRWPSYTRPADKEGVMTVTCYRYLNRAVDKGLPHDRAWELAQEYIQNQDEGIYHEHVQRILPATPENLKKKANYEAAMYRQGTPIHVARITYGVSPRKVRVEAIRALLELAGYGDPLQLQDDDYVHIGDLTLLTEETDE